MYSINFSSKPLSSLFNLSDFSQRTVCFMIKIKASKSVSLYMHTHARVYITICVLIRGRNLVGKEIQSIKPIALMHLSWHSSQPGGSAPLA